MDIDKKPLQLDIYDKIKQSIIWGEFEMGQQLAENHLSRTYGVSRIPIRSALTMLVGDGLVVNVPYRGHFVRPLTPADIKEIYQFRFAIESFAAELLISDPSDMLLINLKSTHLLYGSEPTTNIQDMAMRDLSFHEVPISETSNSRLKRAWTGLLDELLRTLWLASHPQTNDIIRVASEHEAILVGYEKGDLKQVRQALRQHFSNAEQRTLSQLMEHGII